MSSGLKLIRNTFTIRIFHQVLIISNSNLLTILNGNKRNISISLFLFFLAGLCEIGGGYLIWLWLREDMSWVLGVMGGFILFAYGIIPTFQPSHFHRIYAAYGGIFIIMAMAWGWIFESIIPDIYVF